MAGQSSLAAGVLAALSVSALLAQQQAPAADPKPFYQYRDDPPAACSPRLTQTPVDQAVRNGLAALKSAKGEESACWLRLAAGRGSSFAEGALSLLIATGTDGVDVNAAEARTLALKAAQTHNFLADLALYYLELGPRGEETEAAQKSWKAFNEDAAKATREELDAGHVVTDEVNAVAARANSGESKPPVSGSRPGASLSVELPQLVHICASGCNAGKGAVLLLENGNYVLRDAQGIANLYEVVKFTSESVILQRTDYRPRPATATVTGRLSPEGNALVDGKIMFPGSAAPGHFQMAWGDAIDLVPGTINGKPAISACDAQVTAPAGQAIENGVQAMDRKMRTTGICWFRIAAAQGDALAEGALAKIYYRGLGVPVDYAVALKHATKSAAAQNYLGEDCLYLMYASGNGVPKNSEKAELYRQLSERDKRLAEQAEQLDAQKLAAQRQQQADAQQQNQMQGMFWMLSLFGSSDSGSGDSHKIFVDQNRVNKEACANGISGSCR